MILTLLMFFGLLALSFFFIISFGVVLFLLKDFLKSFCQWLYKHYKEKRSSRQWQNKIKKYHDEYFGNCYERLYDRNGKPYYYDRRGNRYQDS